MCTWARITTEEITDRGSCIRVLKDKWVGKGKFEPQKRDKEGVWMGRR